jgi:glycosyltransferase involved in cell wall biosynthesis
MIYDCFLHLGFVIEAFKGDDIMKIGIAARGLSEQSGGVKQYIESIASALLTADKVNEYYVFYNNSDYIKKFPTAKNIVLESNNKLIWDYYLLPKAVRKHNLDIMILPKNVVPFFVNAKSVVIIHDLAYFIPELNAYPLIDTLYMTSMIRSSLSRADIIVSVSENTKKDLVEIIGTNANRIKVVHEAADQKYRQVTDRLKLDEVKSKYNLSDNFIFYSGSLSPRKNMLRFLTAFNLIKDTVPHKLVLTGGKSWKDGDVRQLISQLGDSVIKLGYVPDEHMPFIYNLADLFVYPSLYEGFGLPPLEAMACGCPVIASNSSSIPEVVGDAAVMIDPYDINEIADTMYKVLTDNNLRNQMINKGLKRAEEFSWEKSARSIVELIEYYKY